MTPPTHDTFLDRSLEELTGERQDACLLLEAAEAEHGHDSMERSAAFEDWWAAYRLWFDTWEATWRSHQDHPHHPPKGTRRSA